MAIRIGIVGGGAAGMAAAIWAARNGAEVELFEGNDRVGKKILSTGNGKCNLGNVELGPEKYFSSQPERLEQFLGKFNADDTIAFFHSLGLLVKQKNGGLYPVSEQAASVLDVLRYAIEREPAIQVRTQCRIDRIDRQTRRNKLLLFSGREQFPFDRVILACGGKAAPKTGSDGGGYLLAKQLGHEIVPTVPALVQMKCSEDWFRSVAGVRTDAEISFEDGKESVAERGELQLVDYGISGIPVFQLSRRMNYILQRKKEIVVKIDFLPDYPGEHFADKLFRERRALMKNATVETCFTGLLNKKLMLLFIRMAGLKLTEAAEHADKERLKKVYELCRNLQVHVTGSNSFDNAQVTAGGVPLGEVTERLESTKAPGAFFAGEILDVDGRCGGYNLHWAWCSAYLAGTGAADGN